MALTGLGKLYPDTFRVLWLAAKEALRPMGIETRLDGHTPAPMTVGWEACLCGRQLGSSTNAELVYLGARIRPTDRGGHSH